MNTSRPRYLRVGNRVGEEGGFALAHRPLRSGSRSAALRVEDRLARRCAPTFRSAN